jgi:hypothetical protein
MFTTILILVLTLPLRLTSILLTKVEISTFVVFLIIWSSNYPYYVYEMSIYFFNKSRGSEVGDKVFAGDIVEPSGEVFKKDLFHT